MPASPLFLRLMAASVVRLEESRDMVRAATAIIIVARATITATVATAAATTRAAITATAARATAITAIGAIATRFARFTRRAVIFERGAGFLVHHPHRQPDLAALVDLEHLDIDVLAFGNHIRRPLDPLALHSW